MLKGFGSDGSIRWKSALGRFHLPSLRQGKVVSAWLSRGTSDGRFYSFGSLYVEVLDGTSGRETKRLQLGGEDGMALSPSGELLAVPVRERGKKGEIASVVYIYNVSSGERVGSAIHDHVPNGSHQFLLAGCSAAFTPAGGYLVRSGLNTKVWRIA